MENLLKEYDILVGEAHKTVFSNENDIYQDGTLPMYRDKDGTLWAMSGHTHAGHIGMFKGTCFDDLREVYPIHTNFKTGRAGEAFNGVKYPEGIKSRGSIWPMGLYICPNTHRFFVFFHNETGWNGQDSGYVVQGKGDGEPDFRHIGLMYSDDEGRNWNFSRWVLTAEQVCFSKYYNPDGVNVIGQSDDRCVTLGSGDFTLFVNEKDGFMYLLYNIITIDPQSGAGERCDLYMARSRIREDGVMGDFVKYYNGSFCEAGNLGKESPVVEYAWHARIVYFDSLKAYVMTSTNVKRGLNPITEFVADYAEFRTGTDLLHWSEPVNIPYEGENGYFGNHYISLVSDSKQLSVNELSGNVSALLCHNATDLMKYPLTFCKKSSEERARA